MQKSIKPIRYWFIALLVLSGCEEQRRSTVYAGPQVDGGARGDAGDGVDAEAPGPSDDLEAQIDDYIERYSKAFCDKLFSCGFNEFGDTLEACYLFSSSINRALLEPEALSALIREGLTEFARDNGEACISGLEAIDCAGVFDRLAEATSAERIIVAECARVFVGLQANGAACASSLNCMGESQCLERDDRCLGVCTPYPADGSACSSIADCNLLSSVCDMTQGVCRPAPPFGAACTSGFDCPYPYQCYEGACHPYATLGGACHPGVECVMGLICLEGVCVQREPLGAPCAASEACVSEVCSEQGVCVAPPGIGAPCHDARVCASDAQCDSSVEPPTCVAHRASGEPCSFMMKCDPALDLICIDEVCAPPRAVGEPCAQAAHCESRRCEEGVCAPVGEGACLPM